MKLLVFSALMGLISGCASTSVNYSNHVKQVCSHAGVEYLTIDGRSLVPSYNPDGSLVQCYP